MKTKNTKINYAFLMSYLKYSKGIFLLCVLTSIASASLISYIPKISAKIINADLANIQNITSFLAENGSIFFIGALFYSILFYINKILFNHLANKTCYHIQMDLAHKLLKLKMKTFDTITSGNIMSRFSSDVNAVRDMYALVLNALISSGFLIIVLYANLLFINSYVFLVCVAYLPIIYFVAKIYLDSTDMPMKNFRKKQGEISGFFNESLKAMESIKAYNSESEMEIEFEKLNAECYKQRKKIILYGGFFSWNILQKIELIVNICMLVLFSYLYFNDSTFPIGTLFIIISYNAIIFKYFLQIFFQIGLFKNAFAAAERISELIHFDYERTDGREININGQIEFKNVEFEYASEAPILKKLSFILEKGKTMAFVGKTGCGKSTVMNLMLGFYESTKGDVLLDGVNIKELNLKSIRKSMAVVLQEPYLFTGTIFDNIAMGDPELGKDTCEESLIEVGGKFLLQNSEKGIDSLVMENGKNFSQGERQIICFARAMVQNPKILILDEASSNIDTETEKMINKGIDVLRKGRTSLIIAHRLSTVKNADCICLMEDGAILEQGTHSELMALDKTYAQWYRLQGDEQSI